MAAACTTLVFDGDCAICRSWVSYWQRLTNGRVTYRPYQEAAATLHRLLPVRLTSWIEVRAPRPGRLATAVAAGLALFFVPVALTRMCYTLSVLGALPLSS